MEQPKSRYKRQETIVKEVEFGRLQPQDRDLEEAVLGGLMLEKDAYSLVSEILKPECFYDNKHKLIYEAIVHLASKQEPIDMLTVTDRLRKDGNLEQVGGSYAIAQLTGKVYSASNIEYHARIVAQKYLARELIHFSSEVQTKAFDETIDVDDLMQEAEAGLFKIVQQNVKKEVVQISPVIDEALKKISAAGKIEGGFSGLQTGFTELDKITSGWQQSDLVIVAARPAMGKTAFVLSMARNMAVDYNTGVGLFSLEMPNVQLVNRLMVNMSEIGSEKLKNGNLTTYEQEMLLARIKPLYDAPIFIDDTPSLSVFELRSKARRLVREHNVGIIIIDYLQLMNASGMNYGSREQEVSMISRSLKGLAKELSIPIIALSQLNRSVESREGKKPQLSDLRESGSIEQDADMVCFIHRPEYYKIYEDEEGRSTLGIAEIIVAKHRNGATGDVRLRFKNEFAKFMNEHDPESSYGAATTTFGSKMNRNLPPVPDAPPPLGPSKEPFFLDGGADNAPF